MARITPFVKSITADGDHWLWEMTRPGGAGRRRRPGVHRADDLHRAGPHRVPPRPAGRDDRRGPACDGWYDLADDRRAARTLATSLEIALELPLPAGRRRRP